LRREAFVTKLDDDDLNFLNELDDPDSSDDDKKEKADLVKEKIYSQFTNASLFSAYSADSPPFIKPAPLDAFQAHKMTTKNKEAQLSKELTYVEDRIREATYDRETEVVCSNLLHETVVELRARGFKVTETKAQFIDDPFMWHKSDSLCESVRYVISWKKDDFIN
jgi:hypothetical protein